MNSSRLHTIRAANGVEFWEQVLAQAHDIRTDDVIRVQLTGNAVRYGVWPCCMSDLNPNPIVPLRATVRHRDAVARFSAVAAELAEQQVPFVLELYPDDEGLQSMFVGLDRRPHHYTLRRKPCFSNTNHFRLEGHFASDMGDWGIADVESRWTSTDNDIAAAIASIATQIDRMLLPSVDVCVITSATINTDDEWRVGWHRLFMAHTYESVRVKTSTDRDVVPIQYLSSLMVKRFRRSEVATPELANEVLRLAKEHFGRVHTTHAYISSLDSMFVASAAPRSVMLRTRRNFISLMRFAERLVDIAIALAPSTLNVYVILEIVDWLSGMHCLTSQFKAGVLHRIANRARRTAPIGSSAATRTRAHAKRRALQIAAIQDE